MGAARLLLGLALSCGAAACNADEPTTPVSEPLRNIDIPEDFTFSMTKGLSVEVLADEALAFHAPLEVEVQLVSGDTLYRGPIEAGTPRTVEVVAPRSVDALQVKLTGRSKQVDARVSLQGDSAQVTLR